jgi:hypothetical protein
MFGDAEGAREADLKGERDAENEGESGRNETVVGIEDGRRDDDSGIGLFPPALVDNNVSFIE